MFSLPCEEAPFALGPKIILIATDSKPGNQMML
jgi:hypothetical protein